MARRGAAHNLERGAVPAHGDVRAALAQANEGGFERLIAQGQGRRVLGVVDGESNKVVAPDTPKGTTRLIHNHPRFNDVLRGGGFSSEDIAFASDRYRGNFHVMSEQGSIYAMKAGRNAPRTSYGVDKLSARHGQMVKAMAEELKAGGVSPYEARISARSAAARVLKKEGVISYQERLAGSEKAAVANNRAAMDNLIAKHMQAPRTGGMAQSVMRASAIATPIAAASVAAMSYRKAKNEGKSEARATLEAAGAGAATAAIPAAIGAGAAKLARSSSIGARALGIASRAFIPLSVLGHAGAYAYAAIQRGEGIGGVAAATGRGAINGIIPIDLALEAYGYATGKSTPGELKPAPHGGSSAQSDPSRLSGGRAAQVGTERTAQFKAADSAFREKWASKKAIEQRQGQEKASAETGAGDKRKGWANPNVQRSAQEARGVQNFSDWAERGGNG